MSLEFNATVDQYLELPDTGYFNGWSEGTFCTWFRADNLNSDNTLFCVGTYAANQPLIFWRDDDSAIGPENNTVSFLITLGGTERRAVAPNGSLNDSNWHHVCGVFKSGTSPKLYIDGAISSNGNGTQTGVTSASTERLRIGNATPLSSSKRLDGGVEDCRAYKRALNSKEIETIYYTKGQDAIFGDLEFRLVFNQGTVGNSPTSVKDFSNNKFDFTVNGSGVVYGNTFFLSEKRRKVIT